MTDTDISARAVRCGHEVRTFDTELRASSDGRTIEGVAAPFNSPTVIRDAFGEFTETIRPGAFTRTIKDRGGKIQLYGNHDRGSFPLGNIPRLWEDTAGLRMEAKVANTTAGSDALTLISERVASGLSIGFRAVSDKWNDDYTEREIFEASLLEISLVAQPAYADAGVTSVRTIDGIDVSELDEAMRAMQAEEATAEQIALLTRAHTALDVILHPADPEPTEVPQSIREDMARLYAIAV